MKISKWVVPVLVAGVVAGCQRPTPPAPTTAPAETEAPVPATQPQAATLQVDQLPVLFPQAVLRLSISKGHVNARLSSDDPPEAIEGNYHGNSFDLIMALNITDPSEIDRAVWEFPPTAAQPQRESGYGIFLDGQRRRLHPQDVVASFTRDGDHISIDMKGVFFEYQTDDAGRAANPPARVLVQGRLLASVEKQ